MPSSFTPLLKLELPATGELSGTWGTTVNNAITTPLSEAVAGTTTITVGGSDYTLSNGDGSAANEARKMFIVATGTPGASRNVICPAASKFYVFRNDTNQTLTLKTLSGTGIAVPAGQYRFLYCDGTNVVETFNAMASLTLGTALAAASGGTGQSSYTAGDLLYATGTTALSKLGIGASTTILTSSGTAPQWTAASSVAIGTATNLAGGAAGSVPYQSGAATTTFLGIGAANTVMTSSGTAPQWSTALTGLTGVSTTTATLSGNLTLSGGTANGVLYLDGSKVATSGSALTFDGTNLGVNTASPGTFVDVRGNNGLGMRFIETSTGNTNRIQLGTGSGFGYIDATAGVGSTALAFQVGSFEQMRLDSTGLGIGTSSPATNLEVSGSAARARVSGTAGSVPQLQLSSSGVVNWSLRSNNDGGSDFTIYQDATQRLKIDSSGNLGIGTSSPGAKLDVAGGALAGGDATYRGDVVIRQVGSSVTSNGGLELKVDNGGSGYGARIQSLFNGVNAYGLSFQLRNNSASWTQQLLLDSSGNLGLGVTPSAWGLLKALDISTWASFAGFTNQTVIAGNSYFDGANYRYKQSNFATRYDQNSNGVHSFFTAPSGTAGNAISFTQAMTLDASGRLGIGETSPSQKLTVGATADASNFVRVQSSTAIGIFGVDAGGGYVGTDNAYALRLFTNNSERARIDSSGNLGLGVTPSAWESTCKMFQFGSLGTVGRGNSGQTQLGYNYFINSSGQYIYLTTTQASRYEQVAGEHRWSTAASGTAGNAISFTQAMTLDASGNLGVGTTSPTSGFRLDVQATTARQRIESTTGTNQVEQRLTNTGGTLYLALDNSTGSGFGSAYCAALWHTGNYPMLFATNNSERARITSGGDLLVGGTSTSTIPALNKGIYLQSATNNDVIGYSVRIDDGVNVRRGSMFLDDANGVFGWDVTASSGVPEYVWRTAGQERARITSVGAFLVGTTSTNGAFSLNTNTETWAAWLQQAHTTTGRSLVRLQYNVATPNVATDYFLYCDDATAVRANIRSNGGLANYQSNNVDLSDARTKKDITPAPSYWSKIGALEIVTYKYKDQTHDDINVGVIAQQVEQVEPVWVDTEGFGEVPEGEEPLKTVYTKDITFAAIKALQEAMFRIEALEAKVAALETH